MARLVKLCSGIDQITEAYFIRNRIAEEHRQRENSAAVKIQSWFRGCQVRAYLSHMHRKATMIQQTWRGFKAREHFRQRVKTAYFLMKMNFYNKMAVKLEHPHTAPADGAVGVEVEGHQAFWTCDTKPFILVLTTVPPHTGSLGVSTKTKAGLIQKRWRGYYVRKYVHNYYARKRYLEALTQKNEQVRRELEELAEHQRKERERVALEREEQEKYIQAQRLHFLLSTKQCPGVFNSPFHPEPDEMELRLRRVKPLRTRSAPKESWPTNQPSSSFLHSKERLPPIHKAPQGPFRPAVEVQQQRYRPLEPSLRVATSITALEEAREELRRQEWRTRLIDHPFLPFSKTPNKKYEPLLHTDSPYQRKEYGTKHFREENRSQLDQKEVHIIYNQHTSHCTPDPHSH
ncbi:hypothetical protein NFI96_028743, partial [Prochilodus magdalenae]